MPIPSRKTHRPADRLRDELNSGALVGSAPADGAGLDRMTVRKQEGKR